MNIVKEQILCFILLAQTTSLTFGETEHNPTEISKEMLERELERRKHQSQGYSCEIKAAYEINNNGFLSKTDAVLFDLAGSRFHIDRETGVISGIGAIKNSNDNGQPSVIDKGSNLQTFKSLTIYKPYTTVDYIEVIEHQKGNVKPFIYKTNPFVITGICTHEN